MPENTRLELHPIKGRCVIANRAFKAGDIILVNDVLICPFLPEAHALNAWVMWWTDTEDCIALGHINLLNHSETKNCTIENLYPEKQKKLIAITDIAEGEELTIHYDCKLWFTPV